MGLEFSKRFLAKPSPITMTGWHHECRASESLVQASHQRGSGQAARTIGVLSAPRGPGKRLYWPEATRRARRDQ